MSNLHKFVGGKQFTVEQMKSMCEAYIRELAKVLSDTHVLLTSDTDIPQEELNTNQNLCATHPHLSLYLVPKGTENEIGWYGKPIGSFRFANHWNWFANVKKCKYPGYMQCFNRDLPYRHVRPDPKKASFPTYAVQVAFYGADERYHAIFGQTWRKNPGIKGGVWVWKNDVPQESLEFAKNTSLLMVDL